MKIFYTFFVILLGSFQFSFAQETPESMVGTFFSSIAEGNFSQAVDYIISTNPNLKNDSTLEATLTNNLKASHTRNGVYCGYELIEKEQVSESYINYSYYIKYMNNPVRINFTFYKPREKWQVNSIQLVPRTKEQGRGQEGRQQQGNKNMKGNNPNHLNNPNSPNHPNAVNKPK
jgi:hypothetical protein